MLTIDDIKKVKGPRAKRPKAVPRRELYDSCRGALPEGMDFAAWRALIVALNEELVEDLLAGKLIMLPHKMGSLSLRRKDRKVLLDESGKPFVNTPVDWAATLKLWTEDEDARERKVTLRHGSRHVYAVLWVKEGNAFLSRNRMFFRVARTVKLKIKERLNDGDIDCLQLATKKKWEKEDKA